MNKIRLTKEDSIIMRSDNLPIVDLSKYHTDSKEAHYIQNNHIVNQLTTIKEITEDPIKKAEFDFVLDLKTLISKTETNPEMMSVQSRLRREITDTAPQENKPSRNIIRVAS